MREISDFVKCRKVVTFRTFGEAVRGVTAFFVEDTKMMAGRTKRSDDVLHIGGVKTELHDAMGSASKK